MALLRMQFLSIDFEEVRRLLGMPSSHVVECSGGYIVSLSFSD
jgi:hypothetical protein